MKMIRRNLTKTCRIFATFTELFYKKHGDTSLKNKEISPVIKELYARLYHCYIVEALSLLEY